MEPPVAADNTENVSPITDLSRNLTTLRTMSESWNSTPQMPSKLQMTDTPDTAGSFRLRLLTPGSDDNTESEAEPSPVALDLHRRVVLSQVNKSMQESPFFINRVDSRKAKKRSSLGLTLESSPMRKNSSLGYCSSTSDGFALEEINLEDENSNKENREPIGTLASLLSAPISLPLKEKSAKKFTSARRNLSFAGNCQNETPIKSKRYDEESRGSKRTRLCLTDRTNLSKISKYHSESDIDRAAVEHVIDKGIVEILPTSGAHKRCALPTISVQTMCDILDGKYNDIVSKFDIIDCRWPYEFEGGHISGAKNLFTQNLIHEEYLANRKNREITGEASVVPRKKEILIFHCEFSSERGPKMSQYLREEDRSSNVYPELFYPDVYILQGGYKDFFDLFKKHCVPQEYRKMVDERYMDECRLYRSQSKSFEKQQDTRRMYRGTSKK